MKRTKNIPSYMGSVESFEGESIEKKVSKLLENNEPITDGAPIIFTEKRTEYYLNTTYEQTNGI